MEKRSIVLVDFSESSDYIIKQAYEWSITFGASLLLVNQTVVITPVFTEENDKREIVRNQINESLKRLKKYASEILPETSLVSFLITDLDLPKILKELTANPNFDNLIFMGLKGTPVIKKITLGSKIIQVINTINHPLVALPISNLHFVPKKIFIGVSQVQSLNILALNHFLNFIKSEITQITFFYWGSPSEITTEIEIELKELQSLFENQYPTFYTIFKTNHSKTDLKNIINNSLVDEILILQKGSRLLTDHLFRNFLINDLVYEGQTPLVVLP
jgi:hypothetical protein